MLAAGQVRHRLAHRRLQPPAQGQYLAAAAERVDREEDGDAGGGRLGDGGADVQFQHRATAGLDTDRQAVGEDRLQGEDPHQAGAEGCGVDFEVGDAPEPGITGLGELGREHFRPQPL
ncbi:hypothetical protein D3C85_474020 [compost metagenome]